MSRVDFPVPEPPAMICNMKNLLVNRKYCKAEVPYSILFS